MHEVLPVVFVVERLAVGSQELRHVFMNFPASLFDHNLLGLTLLAMRPIVEDEPRIATVEVHGIEDRLKVGVVGLGKGVPKNLMKPIEAPFDDFGRTTLWKSTGSCASSL